MAKVSICRCQLYLVVPMREADSGGFRSRERHCACLIDTALLCPGMIFVHYTIYAVKKREVDERERYVYELKGKENQEPVMKTHPLPEFHSSEPLLASPDNDSDDDRDNNDETCMHAAHVLYSTYSSSPSASSSPHSSCCAS